MLLEGVQTILSKETYSQLCFFQGGGSDLLSPSGSAHYCNKITFQGALVGVISSLAVTSWVAIGSILYRSSQQSAVTCQETHVFNETVTTISPSFTTVDPSHEILGETNDDR